MDLFTPLFEAEHICLAPMDHEKDPDVISRWTHDAGYMRMLSPDPARPLSPAQVKKQYEKIEKEAEESKNSYYFTIRLREAGTEGTAGCEQLIGFAQFKYIDWPHANANIRLGIGDAGSRGKGYGKEALGLMLMYAFSELNLHRVSAMVPSYNLVAERLFKGAGFVEEVRRREALERDGRRWDMVHYGLLGEEWLSNRQS